MPRSVFEIKLPPRKNDSIAAIVDLLGISKEEFSTKDLKKAIKFLDLKEKKFAEFLGIEEGDLEKYLSGELPIPIMMVPAIKYYLIFSRPWRFI